MDFEMDEEFYGHVLAELWQVFMDCDREYMRIFEEQSMDAAEEQLGPASEHAEDNFDLVKRRAWDCGKLPERFTDY